MIFTFRGVKHEVEVRLCWIEGNYLRFDRGDRPAILIEYINYNYGIVADGRNLWNAKWVQRGREYPTDPNHAGTNVLITKSAFGRQDEAISSELGECDRIDIRKFIAGIL